MPQIAKTNEQVLLEERITKTTGLLRTMRLQLAAIRRRNKAARERSRRHERTTELKNKQCKAFEELWREVHAAEKIDTEADFEDDYVSMPIKRKAESERVGAEELVNPKSVENPKMQHGGSSSSKDTL